jgi:hypothetical protein
MTDREIYQKLAMHSIALCDKASTQEAKNIAIRLGKVWLAKAKAAETSEGLELNS